MAALIPYLYLAAYAHPAADDFHYASRARLLEWPELWIDLYLRWSGRYTANFLVMVNPITFGSLHLYRLMPAVFISLLIFSLWSFLRQLLLNLCSSVELFVATLFLALLFVSGMPSLSEGIYWYSSMVTSSLGCAVTLLYLSLLIAFMRGSYLLSRRAHLLALIALLFVAAGFYEVINLILLGLHASAAWILFRKRSTAFSGVAGLLLVCFAFTAIMMLAPGNSARGRLFPDAHRFSHSLFFTFMQTFRFLFDWLSSAPLLISSALFIPMALGRCRKSELFQNSFYISPWGATAAMLLLLPMCIFPPYWSTGILGQHRTINVAYFFFIAAWFIHIAIWANYFKGKIGIDRMSLDSGLARALAVVVYLSFCCTGNGYAVFTDILYGKHLRLDGEMTGRYADIAACSESGVAVCALPLVQTKPQALFVLDISTQAKNWVNRGYANYFGAPDMKIVGRGQ